MINFIIYEDKKEFRKLYIDAILKIIGSKDIVYKIVEIDKYTDRTLPMIDSLCGNKIYILDVEVPGRSGLDLAKMIRNNGDWDSQIIISTTHEKLEYPTLTSRLLILDYISKYIDCEENIKESVSLALNIISNKLALKFKYNGELYQIPYKDILYIESIRPGYSNIVTKCKDIEVNKTISELEELLKDERFLRTHRSCIINIYNVTGFELNDGIIKFGSKKTNLIKRENKKILNDKILG